jgi:DNA-directed RNA polymerase specialized sigma24 family protein
VVNAAQQSQGSANALLAHFLSAEESVAHACLEQLLCDHAEPVIRKITRLKLRSHCGSSGSSELQDEEDIRSDVILQLLGTLRDLRNRASATIQNFTAYVAGITYNSCNKFLRFKYPARWRLKNRLRYLLNHRSGFTLREDAHKEWFCGLSCWATDINRKESSQETPIDLNKFLQTLPPGTSIAQMKPEDVVHALLRWRQSPLPLEELVTATAELWDIHDPRPVAVPSDQDDGINICDLLPDLSVDIFSQVERRLFLERVWKEICELPLRQRTALLLNLRDAHERDALVLFVLTGISSMQQIAALLEQPPQEFHQLWNRLPLDDLSIAQVLGLSRQQVINLRKSARERLARRMTAFGKTEAK